MIPRTPDAASASGTASSSRGSLVPLRVTLDATCVAFALGIALFLRFSLEWFEVKEAAPTTIRSHALASVFWVLGLLVAMSINRLYDEDTLFLGGGELARLLRSVVEAGALLSGFVFLTQSFYVSRSWFLLVVLFSMAIISAQRLLLRRILAARRLAGKDRRPALLVARTQHWDDWPFEDEHEFEVVGRLTPDAFEELCATLESNPSRRREMTGAAVVLRARDFSHDEFWRVLLLAGSFRWAVFVHSPVRSVGRDRLTVRELAGQAIVKVAPPTLAGVRAVQKRLLDIAMSALLMVLLFPLLVCITLGILFASGRPVLYSQERMGLARRPFRILKFRTMRSDAEEGTGPVWASPDDPRRTTFGRFLRRTSLDELPQLWNVLVGDMSLVGPRPERPVFAGAFEEELTWYTFRHRIRPGITGWAQTHGLRGNSSLDSRVQFDNWYIENWSIWLDLKILLMTVREIVSGRNAY